MRRRPRQSADRRRMTGWRPRRPRRLRRRQVKAASSPRCGGLHGLTAPSPSLKADIQRHRGRSRERASSLSERELVGLEREERDREMHPASPANAFPEFVCKPSSFIHLTSPTGHRKLPGGAFQLLCAKLVCGHRKPSTGNCPAELSSSCLRNLLAVLIIHCATGKRVFHLLCQSAPRACMQSSDLLMRRSSFPCIEYVLI
jgi:hypothetical protein